MIKNNKKRFFLIFLLSLFVIYFVIVFSHKLTLQKKYNKAVLLYDNGEYEEAQTLFDELGFYEDSFEQSIDAFLCSEYKTGMNYLGLDENGEKLDDKGNNIEINYQEAISIFSALGDFKESQKYWEDATFNYAKQLYNEGQYNKAAELFTKIIDYVDEDSGETAYSLYSTSMLYTADNISKESYINALKEYENKNYIKAFQEFNALANLNDKRGYSDSADWLEQCRIRLAQESLGHTISAGVRYSLALNTDGEIKITGDIAGVNKEFLLNVKNEEDNNIKSISGFDYIVAVLKEDGKIIASCSDTNINIDNVSSWEDIIAISTGDRYIVGLDINGDIFGAGHNKDKQWDFEGWENIISFDTAWRRTVGVTKGGEIKITGYGSENHLSKINKENQKAESTDNGENRNKAWNNIKAVATGGGYDNYGHTVGLKSDGTVVAVGDNYNKQCEVFGWKNVVAIAAGDHHTVGLTIDGYVLYAGDKGDNDVDENGYVKGWNNIVAIAANQDYTLALTDDGKVLSFGIDKQKQRPQSGEWEHIVTYDWKGIGELKENPIW